MSTFVAHPQGGSESCPPNWGRVLDIGDTHFSATFDARDYGLCAKSCQKTPPYRDSIVTAKSNA